MNDQAQRLRQLASNRIVTSECTASSGKSGSTHCKSIAVVSGKGGVGKSNIALFLAITARLSGKKVLLLDADLGLANIHILLGCAPKKNLSHVLEGTPFEEAIIGGPGGIDILPGASGLESLANIDSGRLEYLRTAFQRFENNYDYMIFDLGAGIGAGVMRIASLCDMALLILTPEPTSLADAYATVKILYEKGLQKIGVIVNMATNDREGQEIFDRLNTIVVQFLRRPLELFGIVLSDRELPLFVKKQKVLIIENSRGSTASRIRAITNTLVHGVTEVKNGSFFSRFWGSVKSVRVG